MQHVRTSPDEVTQMDAETPDSLSRTPGLRDNVRKDFPHLLRICPARFEEAFRGLSIAQNGRERLIELVTDGAGELA